MKIALHSLAALNILDTFATVIGIRNALIQEANPIMDSLYSSHPIIFIVVKLSLSAIVYALILYNKFPEKKWFSSITYTALLLYSLTFLLHGIWIYYALST
ncbi:DUF5658 family protein [Bacillus sp. P14.5]|uniref:DUF5658 family protein n=1 Tax=Bacillus sp. P14.5 TaxID=1983400 RepID=UPI0013B06289|nr:DUF5658 family protein [Bacillus sp. P14.5]